MKDILKKYSAYIVAAVVFVLVAYIYCFPVLQGKVIGGGDGDTAAGAMQESLRYTQQTGDYSWWNGSMFCGMPNYQIGGGNWEYDNLLRPFNRILYHFGDWGWTMLLYFICFYVLLRAFGVGKWLSIVGALATGLSSYFLVIIPAGHYTKTITIALIAPVIAGFKFIFDKKYVPGALLTMLFVCFGYAFHPQMFYYYCMFIGMLWLAELAIHIKEKRLKDLLIASVIFVAALGIGIGAKSANMFANNEYITQTIRGGQSDLAPSTQESGSEQASASSGLDIEYATQWSYGIDETMTFMIPGFKGVSSHLNLGRDCELFKLLKKNGVPSKQAADFCTTVPMYWGEQPFTAGNVYMGAIVCFLFVLGLLIVSGPIKWSLLAATLFSVALAWGHNCMWLTELFFKYFPMYSKFRAVSSILIVAEVAMPLLGFLAVKELLGGTLEKSRALKSIYIAAGSTAGICLFFALFGSAIYDFTAPGDAAWARQFPDWLYGGIIAQRESLFHTDCWRSCLFILLAALTLFLFEKGALKKPLLIAALGVLVLADMIPVDARMFNWQQFSSPKQARQVFENLPYEDALLQDKDPNFRVMNLTTSTFNDARTSYNLKSIGGYSAVKLKRYQDLIDEHLAPMHMPVLNMLNTKYFITSGEDGQAHIIYNQEAQGNAWFVGQIVCADNAREEIDALMAIDLRNTAVLDKEFAGYVTDFEPGIAPDATIVETEWTPKSLKYNCKSSADGTVVFSEIYYPFGWKAFVDGQSVDIFRVNYTLRAINVPAGEHEISMIFDPDSVKKGNGLSMACIFLMYGLALAAIVLAIVTFIKKRNA